MPSEMTALLTYVFVLLNVAPPQPTDAPAAIEPSKAATNGGNTAPTAQPESKGVVATLDPVVVEDEASAASLSRQALTKVASQARRLFDDLEYAGVIPLARQILASKNSTHKLRMDAYLLLGSCLAITGNAPEAERAFRFLLRGRPTLELSADETAPNVLRVFRAVKLEEDRIRTEEKAREHEQTIASLQIIGKPPGELAGGAPVAFEYRLRDPRGAVDAFRVRYRFNSDDDYSSLALHLDDTGAWRGALPGETTENEKGLMLEYYVITTNHRGEPLLQLASPTLPLRIELAPGTVADRVPYYRRPWVWIAAGALVVGGAAAGYLIYNDQTKVKEGDLPTLKF